VVNHWKRALLRGGIVAEAIKKPYYLLMVSRKGGYEVHSIHTSHEKAKAWAECKSNDGDDVSIAIMPAELVEELA
jgi:hypothetical protein